MKKSIKLTVVAMLLVVCFAFTFVLGACEKVSPELEEALQLIIIPQSNGAQSKPFTLPKDAGDYKGQVTWTSSNPDALELTEQEGSFLATPKPGDQPVTVTVTAHLGKAKRDFEITVSGVDIYSFIDSFQFAQLQKIVSDNFDLPTSVQYEGKTATISWSVKEADSGNGVIKVEGNKVIVDQLKLTNESVRVQLTATFTYGSTSESATYAFFARKSLDYAYATSKWYATTGEKIDVSGYLLALGQIYYYASGDFGNVAVYVIDESFTYSYYFYRINFNEEDIDKLKPGVHVKVEAAQLAPYNGLLEGNNGTLTVDDEDPIDVEDYIYTQFEDDLIGNVPELPYHTGGLVKLSNWKVDSVSANVSGKSGTIATLTKGSAKVTIGYNNAMEGSYKSTDAEGQDEVATALINKVKGLQVGSYVTVTGIMSYFNGWQILPRSAGDVVEGTEQAASTNGTTAKAAIDDVMPKIEALNPGVFAAPATLELPTSSGSVTVSYRVCGVSKSVALDGNKLVITPAEVAEDTGVEVIFTVGTYTTHTYFTVSAQTLDDAAIVAEVKASIDSELKKDYTSAATVELPVETAYPGVTVTWAIKDTCAWASLSGSTLTLTQPETAGTVTLVATIKLNSVTDTKEVVFSMAAAVKGVLARFDLGEDGEEGHYDGSGAPDGESLVFESGNYTLSFDKCQKVYQNARDEKGNGALKLGTAKAAASFSITVGDDVKAVRFYVGRYKTYDSYIKINGTQYELTKNSNDGEYDVIVIDTSTNKTITFETYDIDPTGEYHSVRCMINTIEFLSELPA